MSPKNEAATPESIASDMLKGVAAIASFLGETETRTLWLLSRNEIPGAFKQGRLWRARKSTLLTELRRREQQGAA